MSSFPLSTVMGYLPRAVVPPFAKDIVTIAATFGCLEIWTRIKAQSISEVSAFDNLASWVDYPSAALASFLAYSAFNMHNWKGYVAGTLFIAPLAARMIKNLAITFRSKIGTENTTHIRENADVVYKLLTTASRAALAALSILMIWNDLKAPPQQLMISVLSAAALIESINIQLATDWS